MGRVNDGMKEKKCGCIVFELGPPVLCQAHQAKIDKREKTIAKKAEREQAREEKGLRKIVLDKATEYGHDLSRFKEYASCDGKWVAHCHRCGGVAIVYDKTPRYGDQINAAKLFIWCERSTLVDTLGGAERDAIAARFASELPLRADAVQREDGEETSGSGMGLAADAD